MYIHVYFIKHRVNYIVAYCIICVLQHCAPQDIRFKFGRSNSHSHTSGRSNRKSNNSSSVENTICHKSLPDLHTSTRRRASLSPRASTKLSAKPPTHHQATNTSNCPDYETSSDYSDHSFKRDSVCYRRQVFLVLIFSILLADKFTLCNFSRPIKRSIDKLFIGFQLAAY